MQITMNEPRIDTEQRFLAAYDAGEFERASVTVDLAVVTAYDGALRVLLVRREEHPHKGSYALPGSFVGVDESLDEAAARVLREKARLKRVHLEQLYTFGAPDRDPRTRVITVAHLALVDATRLHSALAEDEAVIVARLRVPWEGETGGPVEALDRDGRPLSLAFDHETVLGTAVKRMRGKLDYAPIGFQLLPRDFTLRQLQDVHETVLARPLNKDSFRRRMLASDHLVPTGRRERDVEHRPGELYRFRRTSAV